MLFICAVLGRTLLASIAAIMIRYTDVECCVVITVGGDTTSGVGAGVLVVTGATAVGPTAMAVSSVEA